MQTRFCRRRMNMILKIINTIKKKKIDQILKFLTKLKHQNN